MLYEFINVAIEDPRIGPSHISLFVAILYYFNAGDSGLPISVHGKDLMRKAKISGMATYHKCMRDLKESGYIRYIPSYNPILKSLVYILQQK